MQPRNGCVSESKYLQRHKNNTRMTYIEPKRAEPPAGREVQSILHSFDNSCYVLNEIVVVHAAGVVEYHVFNQIVDRVSRLSGLNTLYEISKAW